MQDFHFYSLGPQYHVLCIIVEIRIELTCETLLRPDVLSSSADGGHEQLPCTVFGVETGKT